MSRNRYALRVLFMLVVSSGLISIGLAEDADKDVSRLQGTWNIVKRVKNGQEEDAKSHPGQLKFTGHTAVEVRDGVTEQEGSFTIDASKTPHRITMTGSRGPNAGSVFEGIYELEGDTLKLAYSTGPDANTPPKDFDAKDHIGLLTLERQK